MSVHVTTHSNCQSARQQYKNRGWNLCCHHWGGRLSASCSWIILFTWHMVCKMRSANYLWH